MENTTKLSVYKKECNQRLKHIHKSEYTSNVNNGEKNIQVPDKNHTLKYHSCRRKNQYIHQVEQLQHQRHLHRFHSAPS
uniref:Uncharacterized protein n=1 Tax=Arundo donax TaxID=35708 RepID=A0A0A9ER41_ARUDO